MACGCGGSKQPLRVTRSDSQQKPDIRHTQTRRVVVHTKPADNRPMHNYRIPSVTTN